MFRSQDIQVFYIFNHRMIHQICDVMMSVSTWDNTWTTTHEVTKLGQLIDISKDNSFQ